MFLYFVFFFVAIESVIAVLPLLINHLTVTVHIYIKCFNYSKMGFKRSYHLLDYDSMSD